MIWKDVIGYEGIYQISDAGDVKNITSGKILKQHDNGHGYKFLCLSNKGEIKHFYIHRLVSKSFIPNPENKPEVNHKDGNKGNNIVENLEWCSRSENLKHKFRVLKQKNNTPMMGKKDKLCPNSIPIFQLSLDGFIVKVHDSQIGASRELGIERANMWRSTKNNKPYKGYLWM